MNKYVVIKSFQDIDEGTILFLQECNYKVIGYMKYEMYWCKNRTEHDRFFFKYEVENNKEYFAPLIKEYDNQRTENINRCK